MDIAVECREVSDMLSRAAAAVDQARLQERAARGGHEGQKRNTESFARERDEARAALKRIVEVIESAGLHNISRGVDLGPTVWFVKMSDAIEAAKACYENRK